MGKDSKGSRSREDMKLDGGSFSIRDYALVVQDLISWQRSRAMALIQVCC